MSMNAEGSGSGTTNAPTESDYWPLWGFVTKQGKSSDLGGNQSFTCNFCNGLFKGSYSRVRAHLLKISGTGIRVCPKVTLGPLSEMLKLDEESKKKKEASRVKTVPLPSSFSSSSQSSSHSVPMDALNFSSLGQESREPKKRKTTRGSALEKSFNLQVREQLNGDIARMFYSAGLPFNLARNPYFIRAFSFAANSDIPGYVPPGYNSLRTTLLQKERNNIENLLESTRSTWRNKGVSIVCDGWTDPQRRPLINFMAINENGPVFIRAVNCQGEYKDKHFISTLIKEVIMEVGVTNVVQVITDNALVCKAAGKLVEQTYPHVFWTPCVVHTLNLALKNICAAKNTEANEVTYEECNWINSVVASALMIRNFIMNHSMRLAMFNEFSKLKLLAVAETRFASMVVMLRRFKLVKQQLQSMVISEQWMCYRDDDVTKAGIVRQKLLDDHWWDSVDYILAFTDPIYSMLRVCDTDKPCLHLVYEMWDSMILQVRKSIYAHERIRDFEDSTFWDVVRKILEDRWSKSSNPLHCLAYSLNPRSTTKEWESEHPHLAPPRSDPEVCKMQKICLKRLFPDDEIRREVNVELAQFFGCQGDFADEDSIRDRWEIDPIQWWLVHGSAAPRLQSISTKLLGQVSSSSCCERNWSTYAFIHSTKRNKITPQRAEDLVYVHSNLRLLSRKSPQYMQANTRMWDVAGDAYETLDDVGILGIANLSLDEPELESVLFVDETSEEPPGVC